MKKQRVIVLLAGIAMIFISASTSYSADKAGEGNDIWISGSEDGGPLQGVSKEKLPSLKEEDDGSPLWLFPLLIGVVALVILMIIFILSRKKGPTYEE